MTLCADRDEDGDIVNQGRLTKIVLEIRRRLVIVYSESTQYVNLYKKKFIHVYL